MTIIPAAKFEARGTPRQVNVIHVPELNGLYRFEWHPGVKKVIYIDETAVAKGGIEIGILVADQIDTPEKVNIAVGAWVRGYRERNVPRIEGLTGLKEDT
jgi:hypothetical protein